MFKRSLVLVLLLVIFPSSTYASLIDDPRFEVTTVHTNNSRSGSYPGFIDVDKNEDVLILDLFGELSELSVVCDANIFDNERLLLDNIKSSRFTKTHINGGEVKYKIFPEGKRIELYGDAVQSDKPKIVRCDIGDLKFLQGNENIVDDVDFTIGSSGVFYIGEEKLGDINIKTNRNFVRIGFDYPEDTLIKDIELSCIYDGGEDPFDKITINDREYSNALLSNHILYGRFVALGGFFGADLLGKEFNEVFAKERNYMYEFSDFSNSENVLIQLDLKNLEGVARCYLDKVLVENNGEEFEYAHQIEEIDMPGNYGSFGFNDIPQYDERFNGYEYLINNGVISGYEDGTFRPDDFINRAEVAKIVSEAFFEPDFTTEKCFKDVNGEEWFSFYLCNLKENNVIQGVGDTGMFEPARNINVVEAYKMVFESFYNRSLEADENQWYEKYIDLAESRLIDTHSYIDYDKPVNRGEFAEIVYKTMLFDKYFYDYKDSVDKLREFSDVVYFDINTMFDVTFECSTQTFDLLKEAGINADKMDEIFNYQLEDLESLFDENLEVAIVADYLDSYKSAYSYEQESRTYKYDYDYKYHLLGHAANSGCIDLVKEYLDELPYSARNDTYAYYGKNILHVASHNKDFDLIKYLVEEAEVELGILSNEARHEGHYIVDDQVLFSGREVEMLDYLIENGLDINTHSPLFGTFVYETPYTLAANDEIRKFLLKNGYELTEIDRGLNIE